MTGSRGVHTLLFTDIEGSTRLWEEHPEQMELAVHGHNDLITAIVGGAGGTIVRFMGDGVFARFAGAAEALGAAVDIQRAFGARTWPGVGRLRLRAGLHTGLCTIEGGEVFGRPPNLAARLESAAHGGQILLSDATAKGCGGRLRPDEQLFDLGRYHIRGFEDPVVVHSVLADGLPTDFPPLRTPFRGYDELPADDSTLYGREGLIDEVGTLLRAQRFVTLWGPGGIGKTRVALQVAGRARRPYDDGVRFVDLSVVDGPGEVAAAVAAALRAQPATGETAGTTVRRVLRQSRLLLVLDNCEGVLDGVRPLAAAVVAECRGVHVLATSREALRVPREHAVEVHPLPVPADGDLGAARVGAYDAVRLFVDRARQALPQFALVDGNAGAVATLCRALDGVPLAVELAAARLDVEALDELAGDPSALLARLEPGRGRAPDLTGSPRRRGSLVGAALWAVYRLTEDETDLLRRLATFAGSFSRRAALGLSEDPARAGPRFDRLVRTSLVVRDPFTADRFRLLAAPRELARSLTSAAQRELYRSHHARLMLERAERFGPQVLTRDEAAAVGTLRADFADLRAAVELLLESGDVAAAARIVVAVFQFALLQPRPEVYGWAAAVAARIDDDAPLAAEVVGAAALGAWYGGDVERGVALGERALAIAAAHGGSTRLARTALVDALGYAHRLDAALTHFTELVAEHRRSDQLYWQVGGLVYEAIGQSMIGRAEAAERRAEQALALARRLGNPSGTRWAMYGLGRALALRDPVAACAAFEQSMETAREIDSRLGIGLALVEWVELKRKLGDLANAVSGLVDLLEMLAVSGHRSQLSQVVREAGLLLADVGRHEVAALVLLARRGLPEMPRSPGEEPTDAPCLTRLEDVIGEGWTRLSIGAKALDEHELVSLCRRELADLRLTV